MEIFIAVEGGTKKKSFSNKELVTMAKRIVNKAERKCRKDMTQKKLDISYMKTV